MTHEGTVSILDIPALAIDVLRRYMRQRAEQDLPVVWYSNGHRHVASPNPSKSEGAWQIYSNNWEYNCDKVSVIRHLDDADTFEVIP